MKSISDRKKQTVETIEIDDSEKTVCAELKEENSKGTMPIAYVTDGFFVKPVGENMRVKICYTDIVWVEAENSYSHLHLVTGKFISVAHNIQRIDVRLPKKFFVRVSRSEIINIRRVWKYCGNTLYLDGSNRSFTVGKNFRNYIFSCFNELEK